MQPASLSLLTICGLEELDHHRARGVTHVLSILDPDWPDPAAFGTYGPHHRTLLRFHDAVEPAPGLALPEPHHVEAILAFGRALGADAPRGDGHLLIHCHMGISRSTAAMTALVAQAHPGEDPESVVERIRALRPQAWPNLRMIEFTERALGLRGRLTAAVGRLYARQLAERPQLAEVMRRLGRGREIDLARAG